MSAEHRIEIFSTDSVIARERSAEQLDQLNVLGWQVIAVLPREDGRGDREVWLRRTTGEVKREFPLPPLRNAETASAEREVVELGAELSVRSSVSFPIEPPAPNVAPTEAHPPGQDPGAAARPSDTCCHDHQPHDIG